MKMRKSCLFCLLLLVLTLVIALASCENNNENITSSTPPSKDDSASIGNTDSSIKGDESSTDSNNSSQTDHDHIYEIIVLVQPSCGVEGKQVYECVICGKRQHETSIAPLAAQHNYQYSSQLSIAPTCTTAGKKVEHCYTCGQNKEEVWAATGHKWHTKSSCDATTSELVITPYCTRCPLVSQFTYRYKVTDVTKLTAGTNGIYAELDYTIIGDRGNSTILKGPYYAVYCTADYLLIVRNPNSIVGYVPDGAVINGNPLDYYKNRGCTILLETSITISEDGHIKFSN